MMKDNDKDLMKMYDSDELRKRKLKGKKRISLIAAAVLLVSVAGIMFFTFFNKTYVPTVMIYEVYTAGGYFSGSNFAPYSNSYVVLYNSSEKKVDISGWSLLSCSATGEIMPDRSTKLSGEIPPDSFYVIQGGQAVDAYSVYPVGEQLPFDIDSSDDSFSPERRDGVIALVRSNMSDRLNVHHSEMEDYVIYGNTVFAVEEELDSEDDPTVRRVLRRRMPDDTISDTPNSANNFTTVNIINKPANIIRYTQGLTAAALTSLNNQTDAVVALSHDAGLYSAEFNLEITTTLTGDTKVYYTLDGTDPISPLGTISSTAIEYTGAIPIRDRTGEPSELMWLTMTINDDPQLAWPPIKKESESDAAYKERLDALFSDVFKGNVVRVAAVNADKIVAPTVTASYFVSETSFADRYGMPLISIVTDKEGLFDPETGMFVHNNVFDRGIDAGRVPAGIQFFETDGSMGFSENIRLQLHGGGSREYPQKSLRIYTSEGNLAYDLFDGLALDDNGERITNFDRFVLRMGGQDRMWGGIRDAFWQRFVGRLGTFDYQASRPAVVFINGEFWGIYLITERQDDHYISAHYGIPREDVLLVESFSTISTGSYEDVRELLELRTFILDNDMNVPGNYKLFTDIIDVESYIDLFICSIFGGNNDWPHNNWRLWKDKNPRATENTKWKTLMCDTDATFNMSFNPEIHTYLDSILNYDGDNPEKNAQMFRSLMKNDEFRTQFIDRATYLLDNFFIAEDIIKAYTDMQKEVTPAYLEQYHRWDIDLKYWDAGLEEITAVVPARIASFREELESIK